MLELSKAQDRIKALSSSRRTFDGGRASLQAMKTETASGKDGWELRFARNDVSRPCSKT